jgi:hypothetical protein
LIEPSAPVFAWQTPNVRRCAHEGANRLPVAEIDLLEGDDFVNDRRQFAAGPSAFDLRPTGRDAQVLDPLEHRDEDDVPA